MSFFNNPKLVGFGLPFRELEKMRSHMETIYHTLAGSISQVRKNYTGVFPLVNLDEDDDNIYLTAELAGASADTLDVSVQGDTLNLRGQIGSADEAGEEVNFHRREREGGNFRRTITLSAKVDADRVEAVFKSGILTVTMPKASEAKAHRISIKTN